MSVNLNLRTPYSQSVTKLMVKPKMLFIGYNEGESSILDTRHIFSKRVKIIIPQSKYISPKYISRFQSEDKKYLTRSEAALKNLTPALIDLNAYMYKLDHIYFYQKPKLVKKYIDTTSEIFKELKIQQLKSSGYGLIALDYLIDVTTMTSALALASLKKMFLGVLYSMYKQKGVTLPFDKIILSLKSSNNVYHSFLIYDGKIFDIQKTLKIINKFYKLESDDSEHDIEQEITNKIDEADKKILENKLKIKDSEQRDVVKGVIKTYYLQHPDKIDEPLTEVVVKEALKEAVEDAYEIEIKDNVSIKTLTEKAVKIVPPPFIVNTHTEFSKTFNGNFQGGNALNFRSKTFEKNLTDQLKIFADYYKEKYNMKVSKISMKHKSDKSVFRNTYTEVEMELVDLKTKKKHKVKLNIPDISDSNYIKQDGNKRVLLYQLYQYPIVQPFPFSSMLKTNYSSIEFQSKVKNKHRGLFTYISGKNISTLSLFMILSNANCSKNPKCKGNCFEFALKQAGAKYKTDKDDKLLKSELYSFKFNGIVYYVPENGDQKTKQLFWAFKQEFNKAEFTSCKNALDTFESTYGIRTVQNILQVDQYIIDPITKYVLQSENKTTDTIKIYNECMDNAITGDVTPSTNLEHKRIRSSESLAILMFKKLTPAIDAYRNKHKPDIKVDPNIVLKEMINGETQSQYAMVSDVNPLAESGEADKITYSGIGGISSEFAKDEIRMVDDTFYGNIDPTHSPDTKTVGVVRHLAVNATIKNSTGKFQLFNINEKLNPFSLADNYSSAPVHNDGNRIQYAAAQMQSDIPIENSEIPLIASKTSHIFTQVVSDDYIVKAPKEGKVLKVLDDVIVIQYKGESKPIAIPYDKIKAHTSNVGSTMVPAVKEGDQIIKDQPILTTKEFFKNENLALGTNLYTLLKPHLIYNYEDGMIVCETVLGKMSSHHATKMVVVIKGDEAVTHVTELDGEVQKTKPIVAKVAKLEESEDIFKIDLDKLSRKNALLEFDDSDFEDVTEPSDSPPDETQAETNIEDTTEDEDEDNIDQFAKNIYPDYDGFVYDIQIFAKDEDTLKKYPKIYEIRQKQIQKLKESIDNFKTEKIDTKHLERKLENVVKCFGLKYRGDTVENVIMIYSISAHLNLGVGDKLHNRHGKFIAA